EDVVLGVEEARPRRGEGGAGVAGEGATAGVDPADDDVARARLARDEGRGRLPRHAVAVGVEEAGERRSSGERDRGGGATGDRGRGGALPRARGERPRQREEPGRGGDRERRLSGREIARVEGVGRLQDDLGEERKAEREERERGERPAAARARRAPDR